MKKKIAIAFALIFVCFLAFPMTAFPEGENAPLYLALGDSISTGYGLSDAGQQGFAALTADALGYRLQNYVSSDLTSIIPYLITIIMMVYVVVRSQKRKKQRSTLKS